MAAPSFASFPDLDPGPSRLTPSQTLNENAHGNLNRHSRQDKKERSQRRSKKSKDEPRKDKKHKAQNYDLESVDLTQRKHTWKGETILDDEKLKVEEDRRLAQSGVQQSTWDSRPLFFSDRKGDQLNVTYGGIHAGDIPKYHIVDRKSRIRISHWCHLNDMQGGRSILGLDGRWTIYRKGGRGIEISIGRSHKVPLSYIKPMSNNHLSYLATRLDRFERQNIIGSSPISTSRCPW